MTEIKANTCPYCGGPYTVNLTCTGTRGKAKPCAKMAVHERLVGGAACHPVSEYEEVNGVTRLV